jgi:hypothetical protein
MTRLAVFFFGFAGMFVGTWLVCGMALVAIATVQRV